LEKKFQENGLSPFRFWLSSIILTPLALLFCYIATNDIGLINMDVFKSNQKFKNYFHLKINTKMSKTNNINTIEEAIEDIRQGKVI
jgi:hypothetical protein